MKGGHHVKNAHREMIAVVQGQTKTHTHLLRRLLTIFFATAVISLISTVSKEMDGMIDGGMERVERRLEHEVEELQERL